MGGVFPNYEGGGGGPSGRRIKKPREDWHRSRGEAGPEKALALAGRARGGARFQLAILRRASNPTTSGTLHGTGKFRRCPRKGAFAR